MLVAVNNKRWTSIQINAGFSYLTPQTPGSFYYSHTDLGSDTTNLEKRLDVVSFSSSLALTFQTPTEIFVLSTEETGLLSHETNIVSGSKVIFVNGFSSGSGGGGQAPDLSNYVMKNSSQPQTIESDLVIGATKNISLLKNPSLPAHATNKEYVDSSISKAGSIFYDFTQIPGKDNLLLNITGDTIKNGTPTNGSNTSFESAISSVAAFNLQYDTNVNQQSYGVTTGFNDNNRGYDPNLGFWHIGATPRINLINIADFGLNTTTGLTIEIEFNQEQRSFDNYSQLFLISTQQTINTDPQSNDQRQIFNIGLESDANNIGLTNIPENFQTRQGNECGAQPIGNVDSTRANLIITIQGDQFKIYRDRRQVVTATLKAAILQETFRWIILNRGDNTAKRYANMRIFKLRLWRGALTQEQIEKLGGSFAPSFSPELSFQTPLIKQGNNISLNLAQGSGLIDQNGSLSLDITQNTVLSAALNAKANESDLTNLSNTTDQSLERTTQSINTLNSTTQRLETDAVAKLQEAKSYTDSEVVKAKALTNTNTDKIATLEQFKTATETKLQQLETTDTETGAKVTELENFKNSASADITSLTNTVQQHTTEAQQKFTDIEGQQHIFESNIEDLKKLDPSVKKSNFLISELPSKSNILLNLTPYTIKGGVPVNGSNLDVSSVIPVNQEIFRLFYGNTNSSQSSLGSTTGFNDTNRGYSANDGFWWIGKNPRYNLIDISSFNLTAQTGLTFEIEYICNENPAYNNYVTIFGLSTKQTISTNLGEPDHKQNYNIRAELTPNNNIIPYGASEHFTTTDGNLGANTVGQKINMIVTLNGTELKGYRDYAPTYTATLNNFTEVFKWILLNRGTISDLKYANMKIFKMRLWRGALSAEQIKMLSTANMGIHDAVQAPISVSHPLLKQENQISFNFNSANTGLFLEANALSLNLENNTLFSNLKTSFEGLQQSNTTLSNRIDTLEAKKVFMQIATFTKTEAEANAFAKLNEFVQQNTNPSRQPQIGDEVITSDNFRFVFAKRSSTENTWIVEASQVPQVATTERLGIVKFGSLPGEVTDKGDGTMVVLSFADLKQTVDTHTQSLQTLTSGLNSKASQEELNQAKQSILGNTQSVQSLQSTVEALQQANTATNQTITQLNNQAVKTSGNQSIAGVKTFQNGMILSGGNIEVTSSANDYLLRFNLDSRTSDSDLIRIHKAETRWAFRTIFSGNDFQAIKFTGPTRVNDPRDVEDIANKRYVDSKFTEASNSLNQTNQNVEALNQWKTTASQSISTLEGFKQSTETTLGELNSFKDSTTNTLTEHTRQINNLSTSVQNMDLTGYVKKVSDTAQEINSDINIAASKFVSLPTNPNRDNHAVRKGYVDSNFIKTNSNSVQNLNSDVQMGSGKKIIFRDQIQVGFGGGECRITSEDGSTKRLKFYGDGPNNRLTLDLGNKCSMIGVKNPTATDHVANKGYVDSLVNPLSEEVREAISILPVVKKLTYQGSELPAKNLIKLNITPATIKRGIPMDGYNLDFASVLPKEPQLFNLQYGAEQNQQSYGVTTGFNDNNRGYDPNLGFWYIGASTKINYIDISSLALTCNTGFTLEVEFEQTRNAFDNYSQAFSISTKQDLGTNPQSDTHRQNYCIGIEADGSNLGLSNIPTNFSARSGNLGAQPTNRKTNFIITVQGNQFKYYRDFRESATATIKPALLEQVFRYILLDRGGNGGGRYSNMKIYKLRLWQGALSAQEVSNLAGF